MSVATVSRTLGGAGGVSPEARERVVTVAQRLRYRPNAVARSLKGRSTRTLGLVIPNVKNPFFTQMARVVEDEARERGYSLVLGNTDDQPIRTVRFPSNFHLSLARAEAARGLLAAALGDASRIVAEGRADTEPVAPNATAEGREENRRIEVVLLRRPGG